MDTRRLLTGLVISLALTSSVAFAEAPDLTVEYDGWVPDQPSLIKFIVRNNGDAASQKTTGKGETLPPAPPQETAPPIPPIDPGATYDVLYSAWAADDCQDQVVRMSVPLADDADPDDNTLDAQICDTTEGADLKLEYLRVDPANALQAKYRISNVGQEPTPPTDAIFENPGSPGSTVFRRVPALDPGETYDVAYQFGSTACHGDLVEVNARVSLDGDRYPINNAHYEQVCKLVAAQPDPVGPSPRQIHDPVTLTFTGIDQGNPRAQAPDPACIETAVANRPRTVGFQNSDDTPGGCMWRQYWRLLFKFDLSSVRGRGIKPTESEVTFNETVYLDLDANGNRPDYGPRFVATCGLKLGRPVADWYRFGGRFAFEPLGSRTPSGFGGLDDAVARMIADPQVEAQGLVLVGPNEALTPDKSACMSQISNLTLSFTYIP